ncbi:MAG TPA: hypothetical protein DD640_00355 [Clostridiales bacterium]|nr:hypothetical protein [Clostridiales bacterium]
MAKQSFIRDIFRTIWKTKSRFLSIMAIIALGVGFYAGINATEPDMLLSADSHYQKQNLSDFRILSPLGFTEEQISLVSQTEDVATVQTGYSKDLFLTTATDNTYTVQLFSWNAADSQNPDALNLPMIAEGRLPENPGEIVIENSINTPDEIAIGSVVTLALPEDQNLDDYLAATTYTVVGLINSPRYISFELGQTNIGDGSIDFYACIGHTDFRLSRVTDLYVRTHSSQTLAAYSAEYEAHLAVLTPKLEALGREAMAAEIALLRATLEGNAESQLLKIPDHWYVLDRDSNPGYSGYGDDADRIGEVAKVFPLFFFLVAALVCLTTMTRMVEEERNQIGTMKALGYSTATIAAKYLIYALLASLSGALAGLAIGFRLFPGLIMNAYGIMYDIPVSLMPMHLDLAALSISLALITTISAALTASLHELRAGPAVLMQPRAPKPGKRILLEYIRPLWKWLSFSRKVTARNIFRYKKRLLMTVIGIAGCTALLVTGLGLRDSIGAIIGKQFDEIFLYDAQVVLDLDTDAKDRDASQILGNRPDVQSYLEISSATVSASAADSGRTFEAALLTPSDPEAFTAYFDLHERLSGRKLALADDGAIITEKLAKLLNLDTGDVLAITDSDNRAWVVPIAGIAENYLAHYIYLSPEYFAIITNRTPEYNSVVFNVAEAAEMDQASFKEDLLSFSGVRGVMFTVSLADEFNDTLQSLDYVVMILVLSAGALAFIVLFNLTNINITERIREIATIKVLGFRDREVSVYVFRENFILTAIGTAAGLLLGFFLHRFVIGTMEIDLMMFGQDVSVLSYLLAIALTVAFAGLVSLFMHHRLRKVSMVESLKSSE